MTGTTLRVAVVGAGPAGLYVADGLCFDLAVDVRVDLLDRLPTPFGLLRYGVAPDHLRMKALVPTLQKVLDDPRVRFLGNVELGRDVSALELRESYDAVVYATGAAGERRLGIPGEQLEGSLSAGEVVGWYSGHPDAVGSVPLDDAAAVVVGAGNVALDVARVLCKDVAGLRHTDVPTAVLEALAASRVTDVHVLCRRGPADTRFTSKELRELGELDGVDVLVDPRDLGTVDAPQGPTGERNLALLREWAGRPSSGAARRLHLRFWSRPVELEGTTHVQGVRVERTRAVGQDVVGTGEVRRLSAGLVVRSAGFLGEPLPGVPWDPAYRVVPHRDGRVVRAGQVSDHEYAVGWCGRGATGVLGSNRPDADQVVEHLRHQAARRGQRRDLLDLLRSRGVEPVLVEGWDAIDRLEQERGQQQGREREKVSDWPTLLRTACTSAGAVA
jgi:ferredoxin/flavodoxin---NADP+ reductase